MTRNLLLTLAFCGSNYSGFQVQPNAPTVCQTLQDSIQAVLGTRYNVVGCSRTDAGVHATGFKLTTQVEHTIPCAGLVRALNNHLPPDISVLNCTEVAQDFHPRYNATGKKYSYKIWNNASRNPFLHATTLHHPNYLNIDLMHQAAQQMVGKHDFTSFCAAGSSVADKTRTITCLTVTRNPHQNDLVEITVCGDGFLYNMVRIIAGTLIEVSYGKFTVDCILPMIQARDRKAAGATAKPHGLTLEEVYY